MYNKKISLYLNDIKDSINAINDYIASMTFDDFINDRKTYMAVIREFEIIGEAVKNIPDSIKAQYPEIQWRDIVDFRNILIHQYFGVDLEIVWKTIEEDLPSLKNAIEDIEKTFEKS